MAIVARFLGFAGLVSIGLCGQALAQETASSNENAESYDFPDPLPACFGSVPEDERLADCERIILDDSANQGLRKLARFERATWLYREDPGALKTALEKIDLSNAPTRVQGYKSFLLGSSCYDLEDYNCSLNQFDAAMQSGRLPYDFYDEFVNSIIYANAVSNAIALIDQRLEEDREGTGYKGNYSHAILIIKSRLLEWSKRMAQRNTVLKELAGLELDVHRIANEVCWDLVVDYGEPSSAQSACNTAVRLAPTNASNLDSRAVMHLAFADYYSAIADFERALTAEASEFNQAHVRYGLALALEKRAGEGDLARAEQLRAEALALRSDIAEIFAGYKIYGNANSGS